MVATRLSSWCLTFKKIGKLRDVLVFDNEGAASDISNSLPNRHKTTAER